ncbi:hypothetical protein C8N25_11096 [Algoriphagus antarcticus]|uniref:Four-helix bundle copper-binding protein n=1 Tax=Algoriphagus antarcticus TaxID=238540 RepID=A0A3E0DUQ0_9BACT|nr:hypothetical protein C8N25_11096 [Algoriphagus antarcticus]
MLLLHSYVHERVHAGKPLFMIEWLSIWFLLRELILKVLNNLISLKSDCNYALERSIKELHTLIESQKNLTGLEKCIVFCKPCMDPFADCLEACESAQLDRGKMTHACADDCAECAAECEKHSTENCQNCAASCNKCIEELKHVMA